MAITARRLWALPIGAAVTWILSVAAWADALPSRLYEVTTETGMPHLQENLRYATTREARCLGERDLASAFPILGHAALRDCRLEHESRQGDSVSYLLVCHGGHGTTGDAVWRIGEAQIRGTLTVTLGGKNMTFYQRITARLLGECPATTE